MVIANLLDIPSGGSHVKYLPIRKIEYIQRYVFFLISKKINYNSISKLVEIMDNCIEYHKCGFWYSSERWFGSVKEDLNDWSLLFFEYKPEEFYGTCQADVEDTACKIKLLNE